MIPQSEPMSITSPTLHATVVFTVMVFVTVLIFAVYFKIEIVARGQGRLVPVGQVQVVQPEYSGRVLSIRVGNGSTVKEGDVLVELDKTDAIAQVGVLTSERDQLRVERSRVIALSGVLASEDLSEDALMATALRLFKVPESLKKHPAAYVQKELLKAEIGDFQSFFDQIKAKSEINRRSEIVTKSRIAQTKAALDFQAERLDQTSSLFQQGTTSQAVFMDVQQKYMDLDKSRNIGVRELEQKVAEREALTTERRSRIAAALKSTLQRNAQIDSRLATLNEEIRAAKRRIEVATLRAPTSGTVDQLQIFTIGGVAEARKEIMRIVPIDADMEIEASFSNRDIGFMSVGQRSNIHLDAYPSERFGFLAGQVADMAADSTETSDGQWGYRVRITPSSRELIAGKDSLPLKPGMTATVDVTTGKRRIISYFFAPILRTLESSLGER